MSEAPFNSGDRVVCILDDDITGIKVGSKYTIESIYWCCDVVGWRVYLYELSMSFQWKCVRCRKKAPGWPAVCFRKIDDLSDHTTESLLKELSEPVRELEPA